MTVYVKVVNSAERPQCRGRSAIRGTKMVKVITQGNKPENAWFKETCNKCGCVFAFQKHETKLNHGDPRDPREHDWHSINCPTCNNSVYATFRTPYTDGSS